MKKKKIFDMCKSGIFTLLLTLSFSTLHAQQLTVKGTVTDSKNEPLIGVSVVVQGTQNGVSTNIDGHFELNNVPGNANLEVSYVGMKKQIIPVNNRQVVDITLYEDTELLDEVVVTALGIKRSEKSLSYATQKISGEEMTAVPTSNILSSLAGKTAGMMVSNAGAGVGSSVKVVLRGNRSIYGNNQPLYVVDGTPINSKSFTDGANADGGYGGEIDAGDGLAGLNPNDIESINVLKGASASALYGSQAANGVIMITTKRGSGERTSVNFSSSLQADIPYMTYRFQDVYEMGSEGKSQHSNMQWGERNLCTDLSNDFIKDFFNTGSLWVNSFSVSGGNKKTQNYLSYQNTTGKGIIPNNKFNKHNLALRTTSSLFDNFVEIDGSIALMKQDIDHAPSAPGQYFNPIVGLYLFPEGTVQFNRLKDKFEVLNPKRNVMWANWPHEEDINKNPYWLLNRYNFDFHVNKAIAKLNLTFNLTDYLSLKLRGSYDYTISKSERKAHYGISVLSGRDEKKGGRYEVFNDSFVDSYADALLSFNKTFDDFSVLATLGTSISDFFMTKRSTRIDLKILNFFHLNNYLGKPINKEVVEHRQLQSVFGTVSFGWQDMLYLDMTARNDWSSTLPSDNRSYFYPSVGASFIFTEMLNKSGNRPAWLTFGKLRASWTQVGNDMPWGKTIVYDTLNDAGDMEKNTVAPFKDLKPERSSAIETGLNLRMFDNRIGIDLALYKTNTKNQYFLVDAPSGTGFSQYFINAGEISNRGFEATLSFEPIRTKDFTWNTIFNYTTNKNTVVSLPEQYKETGLKLDSGGFKYLLKEGDKWGEMYMKRVKHDEKGRVIVTENEGKQQLEEAKEESRVGNVMPDFLLGWSNEFNYKNVSLSFQIDGRFGGNVISTTQAFLNKYGRSQESADARDAGGVLVPAVTPDGKEYTKRIDAQTWYTSKEGEVTLYDATNVRLREISLSYTLPKRLLENTKYISNVRLSLIGRNLFYIYRDAPFDPEMVLSTSTNSTSNLDNFSIPLSRNIGFSLNINF